LADAALQLELTYQKARGRVLSGELRGGRDAFGRWYVEAKSLAAAKAARFEKSKPRGRSPSRRRSGGAK
jgi:hypothetical protein